MALGGRLRRTWPQRLLIGFNSLLVVACIAAAVVLYTFEDKISSVETISIDSPTATPVDVGEPRNVLIVGTDSAANLDPDDPVNAGRENERLADVIMVMRVDPTTGTARLLSFPRDSRVAVQPSGDMGRINSSIAGLDGARNLIDTLRRNFGISIDNYVEVDFAAFKDLIDQLGGVPVYFAAPVRDKKSGLFVEQPGCVVLGPDQALAYARARNFQYQDEEGTWRYDETGDLGRITRQQDFIKRAMQQASQAGLRNPGTALGVVNAATDAVVMDETLTVGTILDLLEVFRTFNPDDLETSQIPTVAAPRTEGGVEVAYQDIDWDAALPLLVGYWGYDDSGQLGSANVIVDVRGSRSQADQLAMVADGLDAAGFDAEPDLSRGSSDTATITYGDVGFDAALTLATRLVDTPRLVYDEDIVGPRLVLSMSEDFGGLRDQPIPVEDLPGELRIPPSELRTTTTTAPQTAVAESSDPGEQVDDSTTTLPADEDPDFVEAARADGAPPGIVPTDPARAATCR